MSNSIEIHPRGPITGTIRPPGSKSITNRALVCAALAEGKSTLRGALDSDDTRIMVDCLTRLGIDIETDFPNAKLIVNGCGGKFPADSAELFVGNSGTTIRFLTAALAVGHGSFRLDGVARMRQRPIGDLVQSLRDVGVDISSAEDNTMPPIEIVARGLEGGAIKIAGAASSQYLSGLLMAAPYAKNDVAIHVVGNLVSLPYVDMTVQVIKAFQGKVSKTEHIFNVAPNQVYQAQTYDIEPDASAASYFWAAAAVTGGRVTVEGLSEQSMQGDVQFCEALRKMGCDVQYGEDSTTVTGPQTGTLRGIDIDMGDISDTVQTLAVVALFANGPTNVRNVAHIRHKETDRIGDLAAELQKLGADVDQRDDGMTIRPGKFTASTIATYDDHRMAMSFAVAGLVEAGVRIAEPECTSKTYPKFFQDLAAIGS